MIVAVDFDGVLCDDAFPLIGEAHATEIEIIKGLRTYGVKVILWTCRVNDKLLDAIAFCNEHGLSFDAVNDNVAENIAKYGTNPRKVYADFYWDDRCIFENTRKFMSELIITEKENRIK